MAGRTSRDFLRVHRIPMGRQSKPSLNPPQTTKGQASPRKTKGAAALKPSVDLQKQKVEQLCEFLLGKASISDNVFSNCQDSVKRLELLRAEILKEVPWAKDLTEQNSFMGITGLLLKEFQKQKIEIKKLLDHQSEQVRLMEYKAKQIKELQNKHQIQIVAKEEDNKYLISELNNIKLENHKLQEQSKDYLERIENHKNQLKASRDSEKKCQDELKQLTSVMSRKAMKSSLSFLSREVSGKSFKSDSDTCDSSVSFANSETSTVFSVSTERETSQLSELSFANSTKSEEQQFPCILCSQTSHTTKAFLCKQCIDKIKSSELYFYCIFYTCNFKI